MVWLHFSSSMVSCCWLRASTQQVLSSRPSANLGVPSAAAASAWRWAHGCEEMKREGKCDVSTLLRCWILACFESNKCSLFLQFPHELWFITDLMTPHLSRWKYLLASVLRFCDLVCCTFLLQQFIIVTYILAFIWLAVFAFSAIPVFFLFNMEQTCHTVNILSETTASINQHSWICMDARQYGALLV